MSEVFLGINKAGQLYIDATVDALIKEDVRRYAIICDDGRKYVKIGVMIFNDM